MPRQPNSNEQLDYIAALLDDMWCIPGTKIRFGLDAVIGWVPGIGDALAGVASCFIVFASWRRGVPTVTLTRMVANILLEATVGAIPSSEIFSTSPGKPTAAIIVCSLEKSRIPAPRAAKTGCFSRSSYSRCWWSSESPSPYSFGYSGIT